MIARETESYSEFYECRLILIFTVLPVAFHILQRDKIMVALYEYMVIRCRSTTE